jgi:hypothetical protein
MHRWLVLLLLAGCSTLDRTTDLSTVPEASGWRATASPAFVQEFLETLARRDQRLCLDLAGLTAEGRPITVALLADPPLRDLNDAANDPRPKVLLVGSIHPGECEAKEAILTLLRDTDSWDAATCLKTMIVAMVPDWNADGSAAVSELARESQAGPADGCGRRENSHGLDLNRDFMKLECSESRAMTRILRLLDPVLTVDGHTTNGSWHGFDLTYAGPLSPATDPELLAYVRQRMLPDLRGAMAARGLKTFDYGNWRGNWWPNEPGRVWETYDHLPRYMTNGIGLRNRLSLLSEAYVHRPFKERIASTRALMECALTHVRSHLAEITSLTQGADRRAAALAMQGLIDLDGSIVNTGNAVIPVGRVREIIDPKTHRRELHHDGIVAWQNTETAVHFAGTCSVKVPLAFALPCPTEDCRQLLLHHGIRHRVLPSRATALVETLQVETVARARKAFQGHHLVRASGPTRQEQTVLPTGTILIPLAQPLARLVMLLLDPRAPDGMLAWGLLPLQTRDGHTTAPVLRLITEPIPCDK